MGDNARDSPVDEKQCRICLDGEDPALGRLIRPCLCKGSISHVHVKCLQKWRTTSVSQSAFYSCPQCHYNYHFARTQALGIASNPVFVGVLSATLFTLIVYSSSFIATWFMPRDDDGVDRGGYFYIYSYNSPYYVARDLMKLVYRVLMDEDVIPSRPGRPTAPNIPRMPSPPRGWLYNFVQRIFIGLPVVGVASVVHLLYTMSMLWPMHFITRWRGMRTSSRRNNNSKDIVTILLLVAVVGGIIRALWQVYKLTEKVAKHVLLRAEDAILEVS